MSWAATGRVDLHDPTSCKTCFYSLEAGECSAGSHVSRADQGCYAPRVYLRAWLDKKNECGRGATVFRKASGHGVVIMADLSKMASVWFIHLSSRVGDPSSCSVP